MRQVRDSVVQSPAPERQDSRLPIPAPGGQCDLMGSAREWETRLLDSSTDSLYNIEWILCNSKLASCMMGSRNLPLQQQVLATAEAQMLGCRDQGSEAAQPDVPLTSCERLFPTSTKLTHLGRGCPDGDSHWLGP